MKFPAEVSDFGWLIFRTVIRKEQARKGTIAPPR